jgi:hypothetical protein
MFVFMSFSTLIRQFSWRREYAWRTASGVAWGKRLIERPIISAADAHS